MSALSDSEKSTSETLISEASTSEGTTSGLTQTKKGVLQKTAKIVGILSFIAAIVCGGILTLSDNNDEVFRATMGASAFFFFMVSLVLSTIGNTNLPNLKVGNNE
jgi:ABC-type multidrug transport system fused ATPase/permease subunit